MKLLESLSAVGGHVATALLVRHAERDPVLAVQDFLEARLTAKGIEDAIEFGRALDSFASLEAWHSPVERCAETARSIVAGAREVGVDAQVIGSMDALGGPYVRDPFATFKEYAKHAKRFIRSWFDGEYPSEMIAGRRESSQIQLREILGTWDAEPPQTLAVFVTHDWNVLAIREEVLGLRFEEAGWVNFLEGLVLSRRDGTVCVRDGSTERCVASELLTSASLTEP
jgi:broad specificity phosphatase PhoE